MFLSSLHRCDRLTLAGLCLVVLAAFPGDRAPLAGGLAVSPIRLTFEGRERGAEVLLRNNDDQTLVYRLSMVEMAMPEEGPLQILEAPDAEHKSAAKLVRFSPRQVTLQPGQTQTVRVRVRKPGGLEGGEYRSHLLFQNVPEMDNGIEQQLADGDTAGTQIRIVPIYGVAIPVIVRHGEVSAEVALSDAKLTNAPLAPAAEKTLALTMKRSGNRSVHGDLTVVHALPGGDAVEVGRVNGVSVYTPGSLRRLNVALTPPPGRSLSSGTLTVEYRAKAKEGGDLLATSSVSLGGR